MQRPKITATAKFVIMTGLATGLAGCGGKSPGSFDQTDDVSTRLANLMAFNKLTGQPLPAKVEKLECPEIIVLDGTAAHRVYNGPESNETLKYQFSLGDIARECILQGNQVSMKVGIAGQVLLGPAGAPGSFSVPIRVAIVRESDNAPVVSKLYSANVNVPAGQTEGSFTIVTEPMLAPFIQQHTAEDYTIKVGIDAGGAQPTPAAHSSKARHS
jgi:hypothetical protein